MRSAQPATTTMVNVALELFPNLRPGPSRHFGNSAPGPRYRVGASFGLVLCPYVIQSGRLQGRRRSHDRS